ncbi:sensor histidine kinase [Sphingomonas sp.]|uniref:sensor histidine kinase n=1 Tax=Sphingomonas sp. TaxID=28214 RepID=UPI002DB616E9|nr:histidine kinase [Sphingomonas sp.]HEU4969568.1 histidine kinase [Sphingomonas sp.]
MRAGLKMSLIYWTVLLATLTGVARIDGWDTWATFAIRCLMTAFAVAMSWLIILLVTHYRNPDFTFKAILVCVAAVAVSTTHALVAYGAYRFASRNMSPMMLSAMLQNILFWAGAYLGWSALFLAQQYSAEVVDRERQLSELREQAYGAQMRALRYQINPHFLFNTLNALATLIEERDVGPAERMVLSLSAFLRSTLALDPMQDITLAEELDIQTRYLEIERERFSDRLTVDMEVPAELHRAKVPSLILQPLVENAVKHGVGAVDGAVRIRIGASADRNILSVHVENEAPEQPRLSSGTGLGLKNVAERLATRFGEAGKLSGGQMPDGRFRATVSLPLRFTPT